MIQTSRLLKVTLAWVSIVYVVCYAALTLFPNIRPGFMRYGLHMGDMDMVHNVLTTGTFISGLIIWNIIGLLAVWLFASLYNTIKK